jgi:hypothetical protein
MLRPLCIALLVFVRSAFAGGGTFVDQFSDDRTPIIEPDSSALRDIVALESNELLGLVLMTDDRTYAGAALYNMAGKRQVLYQLPLSMSDSVAAKCKPSWWPHRRFVGISEVLGACSTDQQRMLVRSKLAPYCEGVHFLTDTSIVISAGIWTPSFDETATMTHNLDSILGARVLAICSLTGRVHSVVPFQYRDSMYAFSRVLAWLPRNREVIISVNDVRHEGKGSGSRLSRLAAYDSLGNLIRFIGMWPKEL